MNDIKLATFFQVKVIIFKNSSTKSIRKTSCLRCSPLISLQKIQFNFKKADSKRQIFFGDSFSQICIFFGGFSLILFIAFILIELGVKNFIFSAMFVCLCAFSVVRKVLRAYFLLIQEPDPPFILTCSNNQRVPVRGQVDPLRTFIEEIISELPPGHICEVSFADWRTLIKEQRDRHWSCGQVVSTSFHQGGNWVFMFCA
uniref:Uncharacterized protein n=1 Tax=Salix viminalis TaxID=40686 RepID=A0A6N2LWG8_SALVM